MLLALCDDLRSVKGLTKLIKKLMSGGLGKLPRILQNARYWIILLCKFIVFLVLVAGITYNHNSQVIIHLVCHF